MSGVQFVLKTPTVFKVQVKGEVRTAGKFHHGLWHGSLLYLAIRPLTDLYARFRLLPQMGLQRPMICSRPDVWGT
jgi:hypothetical protein